MSTAPERTILLVEDEPAVRQLFAVALQRAGYRVHQARSGEEAVALFLNTAPAFEGGDVRVWDHREMRAVASAEWKVETTRMGFLVRTRSNVFHDEPLAAIAQNIAQREALARTVAMELRVSA